MIKFEVMNRFSGSVQFTAEIEAGEGTWKSVKLGLSAKWALKTGADLTDANLRGADLTDANLRGADLRGANLRGADLTDANLTDAELRGADLRDAYLTDADLRGADLRGADLRGANLRGAELRGAELRGADLRDAYLRDANLRGFKSCLWMTLTQNPNEAQGVADALREGRVDGSTYSGECACLVGTIGNLKGVDGETLPHNSSDPSERWFMMISEGDTPDKDTGGGYAAKLALEWVEEWIALRHEYIVEQYLAEPQTDV